MNNVLAFLLIVASVSLIGCSHNNVTQPESLYKEEPKLEKPVKPYTEDGVVNALAACYERTEVLQKKIDALNPYH